MSLTDRSDARIGPTGSQSAGTPFPALFSVDLLVTEDETILALHGELDIWTQREFVTALTEVGDDVKRLVLDLSDLAYIDVGSIGVIHQHRTVLEARGGTLTLRSPHTQLKRIFEITGLLGDDSLSTVQHRIVLPLPARAYERTAHETNPS